MYKEKAIMTETPRTNAFVADNRLPCNPFFSPGELIGLARSLEIDLIKANKIIETAKEHIREFQDFFPEDTLMTILEGKINEDRT